MRSLSLALLFVASLPVEAHPQVATSFSTRELRRHVQMDAGQDILARESRLEVAESTLRHALQLLQERSGVSIAFSPSLLPMEATVTCRCSAMTVGDALRQILPDDRFSFNAFHGQVLIVRDLESDLILPTASAPVASSSTRPIAASVSAIRAATLESGRRYLDTSPPRIQNGAVTGRVTAAEQGRGLANVAVTVEGTNLTTVTGPDGRFNFPDVPPGQYSVTASILGRRSVTHDVSVRTGETTRVDVVLEIGAISLDALVVAGTVVPTAIREVPTPVTVVTRADINRLAPRNVAELVRSMVPGAIHTNEGPAARYGSFSVRGVSGLGAASTLKVYIDGVEVSDPAYVTNMDPAIVERVEIISGPQASTIYGSRAISGVMQIFTRRATAGHWTRPTLSGKVALQQVESPYVSGDARGVEYGTTVSGGDLSFGYTGGVNIKDEPQWLDLLAVRNRNFFGSVNFSRGRFDGGISARYQNGYDEPFWNPLYRQLFQATGRPDNPPSTEVYDSRLETYSVRLGFRAAPWWQHNLTTGYDGFERHWYNRLPNANSQYGVRLNDTYRTSLAYNTAIQRRLTADLDAKVVLGADRSRYKLDSYGTIFVDNWRSYPRPELSTAWRRNSDGYFGQAQLGHKDRIFLTTGLRADRYPSGSNVGTTWSPRVGLTGVLDLAGFTIKPRVAWGQSVIVPDERAVGGDESPSSILLANPDVRSQLQRGYDAGLDVFLPGTTFVGITYFDQDPIDLIELVRVGTDTTGASPRAIFQYQNLHRVKNRGWEIKVEAQPLPQLSLGANYGRTRSTVRALDASYSGDYVVGQRIPGQPGWTASARAAYSPVNGTNFSVDMFHFASWRAADFYGYLSDIYSGTYNPSERAYPSGYLMDYPALTKWNAGVSQALPRGLTVFGHVHNLTNSDRFERLNMIIPQPRTWTFGLRFDGLGS
jgi:outer membrane receptor protein involved in Fe transport